MLILLFTLIFADPIITVPEKVQGQVGSMIYIEAQTEGKDVKWYSCDSKLELIKSDILKSPKIIVVVAKAPGEFKLVCFTSLNDKISKEAVCTVSVGGSPNPDPPPGPTPTPEFLQSLQNAYNRENDPNKNTLKDQLSLLFKNSADTLPTLKLKSVGDFNKYMQLQVGNLLNVNNTKLLPIIRETIGMEMRKSYPATDDDPLDLGKAQEQLYKFSDALSKVK